MLFYLCFIYIFINEEYIDIFKLLIIKNKDSIILGPILFSNVYRVAASNKAHGLLPLILNFVILKLQLGRPAHRLGMLNTRVHFLKSCFCVLVRKLCKIDFLFLFFTLNCKFSNMIKYE